MAAEALSRKDLLLKHGLAEEVLTGLQVVKVMSGLIRVRFANQPELLAAWESASNVVAAPRPEEKPATGEVRPAA